MQSRLYVFNLVTGAVRTWSHGGGQVWLLDTTAPGSDLLTRSKPVAGQQGNGMGIFHGAPTRRSRGTGT